MRHQTISDRIAETYKISNQMLGYLEKQIILDYHLRGEQSQFEEDHEDLKKKAQSMFGLELYYELGGMSKPLTEAG